MLRYSLLIFKLWEILALKQCHLTVVWIAVLLAVCVMLLVAFVSLISLFNHCPFSNVLACVGTNTNFNLLI